MKAPGGTAGGWMRTFCGAGWRGLAAAPAAAEAGGLTGRRVGGGGLDHGADGVAAAAADRAGPAGLGDLLGGTRARVDGLLDGDGGHAEAETDVHLRSRAPRGPAPGARRTAAGTRRPPPPP